MEMALGVRDTATEEGLEKKKARGSPGRVIKAWGRAAGGR